MLQSAELGLPNFLVVHLQNIDRLLVFRTKDIHAHKLLPTAVNTGLLARCGLLNPHFGQPALDRCCHAAHLLHLTNETARFLKQLICEVLHVVGSCPRVHCPRHPRLFLQVKLRISGNPCGKVGRQGDRLVQGIGVKRLRATKYSSEGLDGCTCHVVEGILLGKTVA